MDQLNLFEKTILCSIVTYPYWLGSILAREEGYTKNHGLTIPIPTLSLKIINVPMSEDYLHITLRIQKSIHKPDVVESSNSIEEDDEDDGEESTNNEEEVVADKEDDLITVKG
ncbi:unnamed protein product [Lactuca saligna]|uniref:Uncharacterized protein n=1 Tax=Lactuca saligna TaxID=75948 RepID=A0AA36E3Y4_LACSI|nr:unnamed protein product [Lactuca saligna]